MRNLVIDVGCSRLKMYLFDGEELLSSGSKRTPEGPAGILSSVFNGMEGIGDYSNIMVISYGDSVWYETKSGEIKDVPVFNEIPIYPALPDYQVSGKPINSELKGMANALYYLRDAVGLEDIVRILPPSTFIASKISMNDVWNKWDITHASNSGMWDYNRAAWCVEMSDFLEAGVISHEVVKPDTVLWSERDGYQVFTGGMDSLFFNANDIVYSTKPYLSLGTWVTASFESYFRKRDRRSPTRFVIAPNGTILEQLCFRSESVSHRDVYSMVTDFFEKRMGQTEPRRINIFGGWSGEYEDVLQKHPSLNFALVEEGKISYLHRQVAKYMSRANSVEREMHLPVSMHAEGHGI